MGAMSWAGPSSWPCGSGRWKFYSKGSGCSRHCRKWSELKAVLPLAKAATPSLPYKHHTSTPRHNSSALSEQSLSKTTAKQMAMSKRGIPGRQHIPKICQRLHEVCSPFTLHFTQRTLGGDSGGGSRTEWCVEAALQKTAMQSRTKQQGLLQMHGLCWSCLI